MAPKKKEHEASSSSRIKSQNKGVDVSVFDPGTIEPKDRFFFNLMEGDENVVYNFLAFIIEMRHCASLVGKKLTGETLYPKLCLGERESYDNPYFVF